MGTTMHGWNKYDEAEISDLMLTDDSSTSGSDEEGDNTGNDVDKSRRKYRNTAMELASTMSDTNYAQLLFGTPAADAPTTINHVIKQDTTTAEETVCIETILTTTTTNTTEASPLLDVRILSYAYDDNRMKEKSSTDDTTAKRSQSDYFLCCPDSSILLASLSCWRPAATTSSVPSVLITRDDFCSGCTDPKTATARPTSSATSSESTQSLLLALTEEVEPGSDEVSHNSLGTPIDRTSATGSRSSQSSSRWSSSVASMLLNNQDKGTKWYQNEAPHADRPEDAKTRHKVMEDTASDTNTDHELARPPPQGWMEMVYFLPALDTDVVCF